MQVTILSQTLHGTAIYAYLGVVEKALKRGQWGGIYGSPMEYLGSTVLPKKNIRIQATMPRGREPLFAGLGMRAIGERLAPAKRPFRCCRLCGVSMEWS